MQSSNLNKVNNIFKLFANQHKILKSYLDINIIKNKASNYTYPMMLVDWTKNVQLTRGSNELNCDVYILDKTTRDYLRLTNILSDNLQTCDDFHTYFIDNLDKFGFTIDNDVTCEPIAFDFEDIICGYKMNIHLTIDDNLMETEIPI